MGRVIFYIDGFNFYYGLKAARWKKFYWLDIVSFCQKFVKPYQTLVQVNYFSAVPYDKEKGDRQDLFFSANKLNNRFSLHLGKFLRKTSRCKTCHVVQISFEEKESGVRIATRMISDVVTDRCDVSILISADSDLIPPIEVIRELKPQHKIYVYFPPQRRSFDLSSRADRYVKLERHEQKFAQSLLPNEITLPVNGYVIRKPSRWI
jgi:uncharacterized LabA/DUF88 family protein